MAKNIIKSGLEKITPKVSFTKKREIVKKKIDRRGEVDFYYFHNNEPFRFKLGKPVSYEVLGFNTFSDVLDMAIETESKCIVTVALPKGDRIVRGKNAMVSIPAKARVVRIDRLSGGKVEMNLL